ncbi:MAG: PaaI family thioesterase [Deltaproteobacteria bacterium]|nr:PaaI family thioesterase [Deltaproteobacteria bacterium]MBW2417646.1 PaaI family thioesterase [Deltaproteobacteria bacterium]
MDESKRRRGPIEAHWDATKSTGHEMWEQKRRLADAMRLVIERLVPSNAPVEELKIAADGLERYAEALTAHPRLERGLGHAESATSGDVGAFFDQSPLIGLANPLAPPITVGKSGERSAEATVVFGSPYEGPPGSVHGGFVAAAFDEVLGYVQSLSGNPGMTGTLTVRYRKPTPLHTELYFEAEIVKIEGRKIHTQGKVWAGEVLCAEAEGLFISINPKIYEELMKKRDEFEAGFGK